MCSGMLPAQDITPFTGHVPTVAAGRPERDPALGSVVCDELNHAAVLRAATTPCTGPNEGVATRHVPDAVIACGAGTR
ncbi:hypothetical protein [Streptomyces sp. NPDC093591]|uniref:hypothetical protein n=1 Tax=Streptomyces sp. NPDC093591 TaxID=3366044 RepID=UPI0037F58950